ncbi:heterokaryon incompatibility protein-domain-containing protein [Xylogone sp. PMI_703]|nr:heterokaryon incompatibility protein-domain-containing protein [Xylogone sp. PMI_703]
MSLRDDEEASLLVDVVAPSSTSSQSLLNMLMDLKFETPSSATWKMFDFWLDTCDKEHTECRRDPRGSSQPGPARLIDVQSTNMVRLINTDTLTSTRTNHSIRYAAVSHCWGTTHEPQLNEKTANVLKLYRDAIILARYLQIPYLWIDSLCIVEDSPDDWRRESTKMGAICENSYLCIAASASTDNNSGFLEKHRNNWRQPLVYENLAIHADIAMAETNLNIAQAKWSHRMRTLSEWAVDKAPLNQRAWVLQERMFVPRILHCTAVEFVWECCRGMRSESHPVLTSGGSMVKDVWRELYQASPLLKQPSFWHLHLNERRRYLERWSQIVGLFTSIKITFPQDWLPACSAIAKRLQPILGEYAAGLWERYLPSQLL